MAAHDNVRVLYEDGLVLGADEMQDDQRYYRAGFERRSLARDVPGIAYGLGLSKSADGLVSVEPGVAYAGDGRVIVLRSRYALTPELSYEKLIAKFDGSGKELCLHVYLRFGETEERGVPVPALCNSSLDPRVAEGYQIEVVEESRLEHLERTSPSDELGAGGTGRALPIRLGRVCVALDHDARMATPNVALAKDKTPCEKDPAGLGYPSGAQYIGTVTEGLVHPKRWSDAGSNRDKPITLRLLPERGVEVSEVLQLLSSLILRAQTGDSCADLRFTNGELELAVCDAGESQPVLKATKAALAIDDKIAFSAKSATIGTLDADRLNVSGSLEAEGLKVSKLAATKGASLTGNVTIAPLDPTIDPPVDSLTVSMPTTINAKSIFNAPVELKTLAVSNGIQGNVGMTSDLAVGGALNVKGAVSIGGVLTGHAATLELGRFDDLEVATFVSHLVSCNGTVLVGHAVVSSESGAVQTAAPATAPKVVGIASANSERQQVRIVMSGLGAGKLANDLDNGAVEDGQDLYVAVDGTLTNQRVANAPRVAKAMARGTVNGDIPVLVCP